MKTAARIVYGTFGTVLVFLSLVALLRPGLILSRDVYSPLTAHLIQEQGAEGLFIALMTIWCLFNLDRRRPVHLALLVFAFLFSAIHWAAFFHDMRSLASPLVNSVPFLALLAVTPFKSIVAGGIQQEE